MPPGRALQLRPTDFPHDTSNHEKGKLMTTAERRVMRTQNAIENALIEAGHHVDADVLFVAAEAAQACLDAYASVPVTPPVTWVCACDEDNVRCPVHGWVARAASAR
jgi:hypothetical protein